MDISWGLWALGFLPVGILLFAATPLLAYFLYPPEIKRGDEVARWARGELISMGRITRPEVTMGLLAVAALVGWIGGSRWISPVTVALASSTYPTQSGSARVPRVGESADKAVCLAVIHPR